MSKNPRGANSSCSSRLSPRALSRRTPAELRDRRRSSIVVAARFLDGDEHVASRRRSPCESGVDVDAPEQPERAQAALALDADPRDRAARPGLEQQLALDDPRIGARVADDEDVIDDRLLALGDLETSGRRACRPATAPGATTTSAGGEPAVQIREQHARRGRRRPAARRTAPRAPTSRAREAARPARCALPSNVTSPTRVSGPSVITMTGLTRPVARRRRVQLVDRGGHLRAGEAEPLVHARRCALTAAPQVRLDEDVAGLELRERRPQLLRRDRLVARDLDAASATDTAGPGAP